MYEFGIALVEALSELKWTGFVIVGDILWMCVLNGFW